ncbi:MAG TPA: hypothetical protein VF796_12600 [Humisphaera sp.]
MALIQIPAPDDLDVVLPRQTVRVYTRAGWADPWRLAPYLYADTADACVAPSIPSCRLRYHGGRIKREDDDRFRTYPRAGDPGPPFVGRFVRVDVTTAGLQPATLFVGRITSEELTTLGESRGPTRDYELAAVGLAKELERATVGSAVVWNGGADDRRIGTPLVFNERFQRGWREVGNRTKSRVTDGFRRSYQFGGRDPADGSTHAWRVRDIAEYLLFWHAPDDMRWALTGQVEALDALEPPRVETAGRTVWDLLNQVIDRRRGVGFVVEPTGRQTPQGELVAVRVFTVVDRPVAMNGVTLPANPAQQAVALEPLGHLVDRPSVSVDELQRYGEVEVAGEPVVACFTVSFADGTLRKGWTDAAEVAYLKGNANDSRRHDEERGTDKFRHVFAKVLIPDATWAWRAGDGQSRQRGTPLRNVHARVADNTALLARGTPDTNYRTWGHTLLRKIPLVKAEVDAADPDAHDPEYRDPIVLIHDPKANALKYVDYAAVADDVSASVRVLDREFGLEVRASPNHLLAKDHWPDPALGMADGQVGQTGHRPTHDYATLIATVAARQDNRFAARGRVPFAATSRRLTINVPDAELWWVQEGTVLDLLHGEPVRAPRPVVVRDDGDALVTVLAFALAWYGRPRASLRLPRKDLSNDLPVGTLVTRVALWDAPVAAPPGQAGAGSTREVNSVVTRVSWDFEARRTVVETNFGELDFAAAAGTRSGGTLR